MTDTAFRAARSTYWFASAAHPLHALHSLLTAVGAAATVVLVFLKVYAPAVAASLVRSATVAAAATVALVGLEVDAPLSTASLPF
jgi:hypothetical protein